jgi:serine/threonine protein kinase
MNALTCTPWATIYEMCQGRPPFTGSRTEILAARRTSPPPALERDDLPRAFTDLVFCLLAPECDHRPATAAEVVKRLEELCTGTPPYQPPDANLTRWDVSPDLFAVGVVLYQLLCDGQHPYPNKTPIADEPVIDPRTIRSDLNPALAEFLLKACASAHAGRFPTAVEMQLALRKVRADL